jgi:hypothetical protein
MAGTPRTHAGKVAGATMDEPTVFNCPNCDALYKLVRMDAPPSSKEREITCRRCGAPLRGREGAFILKFFLVKNATRRDRESEPLTAILGVECAQQQL